MPKINDLSFKDMLGFLWGFIGTGVTLTIILFLLRYLGSSLPIH